MTTADSSKQSRPDWGHRALLALAWIIVPFRIALNGAAFADPNADRANQELGLLLADETFRLWAKDNGLPYIGYPSRDQFEEVVGARPGRDLAMAFQRYRFQQLHPDSWGRPFRRGGGSLTCEIVEVRFVNPSTPFIATDDSGVKWVRVGREVWDVGQGGLSVARRGSGWETAPFVPAMKADGKMPTSEELRSASFVRNLVPVTSDITNGEWRLSMVGEREALHAELLDKHESDGLVVYKSVGEADIWYRGYVAVVLDSQERIVIPGYLHPVVSVVGRCETD